MNLHRGKDMRQVKMGGKRRAVGTRMQPHPPWMTMIMGMELELGLQGLPVVGKRVAEGDRREEDNKQGKEEARNNKIVHLLHHQKQPHPRQAVEVEAKGQHRNQRQKGSSRRGREWGWRTCTSVQGHASKEHLALMFAVIHRKSKYLPSASPHHDSPSRIHLSTTPCTTPPGQGEGACPCTPLCVPWACIQ